MSLILLAWLVAYISLLVVTLAHLRDKAPLRTAVLLPLVPLLAPAQLISIGVTGGIPISPHSQDYGEACLFTRSTPVSVNQTICGPNRFFVKPYAVGPTLAFHLPWRVSVEAGMLYERFHKDVSQGLAVIHGGSPNFGQYFGASANGWLFPLELKYIFGPRQLSPFINAGATLRHLGPFDGMGTQVDFFLQPQPTSFHFESGRELDVAEAVGAGLRWRGVFDVSPEIRFLHWTSEYCQPVQNQLMLMVGITFPAWR